MAIAILIGACNTGVFGTGSLYFLLILGGSVLLLAPVGACGWLVTRAKQLNSENHGFPVIQAKTGEDEEGKS